MMRNTSMDLVQMSDVAIVRQIGTYIKHVRLQQNKTQAQLAEMAGLNRWTISQIENGESITLTSFIQILRALDSLLVLNAFEVPDEISPLEYAKLKKHKKERVRNKPTNTPDKDNLRW
jgi:transcriptional regulator with XRE-family HTH domain